MEPPAHRFARTGLAVLVLALILAVLGQLAMTHWMRALPVFGPDRDPRWVEAFDQLAIADAVQVKYAHALQAPRYQYGLFGNSRSVSVPTRYLDLPPGSFFNFSQGGTSFRQSVALLQALHDAGKAPSVAVISMDNHDNGFFAHVEWPSFWSAPGYHLATIREALEQGAPASLAAKMAVETAILALRRITMEFNIERLIARLRFLTARMPPIYLADGARAHAGGARDPGPSDTRELQRGAPVWPNMAMALETDIVRLGKLNASGIRVVVYESPIVPHLLPLTEKLRDPATAALRARLQAACERSGITCLPAPVLKDAPLEDWVDCCHPPTLAISRHVAGLFRLMMAAPQVSAGGQ